MEIIKRDGMKIFGSRKLLQKLSEKAWGGERLGSKSGLGIFGKE